MKRVNTVVLSVFVIILCSSCYHSHNYPDENSKTAYNFCEKYIVWYYESALKDFSSFLADRDGSLSHRYDYIQVNDTCWRILDEGFTFNNGISFTIDVDSVITYHQDAYVEEDEYRSHVFTLNNGVKGGNGTIRLEVSVDGKEYGWGQMDFSNGNLNITTGAY